MNARLLPPDEWGRVEAPMAPLVHAEDLRVFAVEDGPKIVGSITAFRAPFLETPRIAPEYKGNVSVGRKLLRGVLAAVADWGTDWVMAGADRDSVRRIIIHLGGQKVNADTYIIRIRG